MLPGVSFKSKILQLNVFVFGISLFLSLLVFPLHLFSQKIEIGAGFGAMNYKGDISPDFHPGFARLGGNIMFRYNLNNSVSFRASALLGKIYADDKQVSDPMNQIRGMSFNTKIDEIALIAEYNFFNYKYSRYHKDWSPYVFGGLAAMKFSPDQDPIDDYKTNQIVIPFGVGIKYNIKRNWGINLEFGTRKTFTDYLDNLGGNHPGYPKFPERLCP
ncbi:DUF6089 family protein [Pseudarcicella hirudinis]|uniref:type IX secretion system protein PorG n=1 Tax=Pseudarcicella hirudinis TaxID=1079859 RepID=UPI0035E87AD7